MSKQDDYDWGAISEQVDRDMNRRCPHCQYLNGKHHPTCFSNPVASQHLAPIPRWIWVEDEDGDFYMSRSLSGDWVKYEDHESALRAVREERDFARGRATGHAITISRQIAELARERESRKQAEAAAIRGDSMLSLLRHRAEQSIPWGKDGLPDIWRVDEVIGQLRRLSKPVQEPAERERGK
jgi:hypothetical protein